MSLIVINKLGEDTRGRRHEFMIAIEVKVQKVQIFINWNKQILWIIDSIEHLLFQSGLSHVLPLFSNVRKTSYTPSSHVMLVQRHGWDLNNIWISIKSDTSFSKLDFLFFSLFGFHLISFFSDIQEFNKIYVMSILNGKAGISLSLALPSWSIILTV